MENNIGYFFICGLCLVPYVAGIGSAFYMIRRVTLLGRWAWLPFGGTFKHYYEERQG